MRITADRIQRWAGQQSAPGELPSLIRRLAHATTTLQSAAMPGGEAVNLPGWDGQSRSDAGSTWVPSGAARWEWSCEKNVPRKATEDFEKRTAQTAAEQRASSTFNRYRRHAAALHNSHPLVAAMLENIAESYDQDGKQEDDRAKLMMERG